MMSKYGHQIKRLMVCPVCGRTYQATRAFTCGRVSCIAVYQRKRKRFAEILHQLPLPFKWEEPENDDQS